MKIASTFLLLLGVIFLLVACGEEEVTPTATATPAPSVTVSLASVGGSGQNGYATLTSLGEQTEVVISVASGPTGVAQPAHIHDAAAQGGADCALPPKVVYPLTNVVDGRSTTVVNVSLATLQSKAYSYSICVHKSVDEAAIYTAEGAIPR